MNKTGIPSNLLTALSLVLFSCVWLFYLPLEGPLSVNPALYVPVDIATNAESHPFPWAATAISVTILLSLLSILICLGQGL